MKTAASPACRPDRRGQLARKELRHQFRCSRSSRAARASSVSRATARLTASSATAPASAVPPQGSPLRNPPAPAAGSRPARKSGSASTLSERPRTPRRKTPTPPEPQGSPPPPSCSRGRQFQHRRNQQPLRSHGAGRHPALQPLEKDPLVRRPLVEKNQALPPLEQQITPRQLADQPEFLPSATRSLRRGPHRGRPAACRNLHRRRRGRGNHRAGQLRLVRPRNNHTRLGRRRIAPQPRRHMRAQRTKPFRAGLAQPPPPPRTASRAMPPERNRTRASPDAHCNRPPSDPCADEGTPRVPPGPASAGTPRGARSRKPLSTARPLTKNTAAPGRLGSPPAATPARRHGFRPRPSPAPRGGRGAPPRRIDPPPAPPDSTPRATGAPCARPAGNAKPRPETPAPPSPPRGPNGPSPWPRCAGTSGVPAR